MNGPAQATQTILFVLVAVVVVAALYLAQEVLIPVALALLAAFLLAPLVERLHRWGVNRALAVIVAVTIAFGLVSGLFYVVFHQFVDLVEELPQYRQQLRVNITELSGTLRGGVSETTQAVEQLTAEIKKAAPAVPDASAVPKVQVVEPPLEPLEALAALFGPFLQPLATAALMIVFTIFMLLRYADMRDRFIRLVGPRNLRATTEALDDAAKRVSRYLLMQTAINAWQGMWVAIGLTLIGLPNAALFGALTLVLRFIPYVGPWVAAAAPIALSFAVFDHWVYPLMTIALFVLLESISNMVLEPWLYGRRTGVSPVALLVAAAFWTWLWGAVGLFLAVPLTVCLVVMGKYIPQLEFLHVLLGDQPVLEPHERLYQRLLASNREEADELLEEALRSSSLLEVCDRIVVPAMQLAEIDHERGALREAQRQLVLEHIDAWADELVESGGRERGEGAPTEAKERGAGARVLCLPAADRADEIAAKLLCAVLTEREYDCHVTTRSEARRLTLETAPDVAVISALPPDSLAAARLVCKRVRGRFGQVPMLVGLWHARGDLQRSWQRLEPVGATRIATSFGACVSQLEALAATSARPVEVPARPAAVPPLRA